LRGTVLMAWDAGDAGAQCVHDEPQLFGGRPAPEFRTQLSRRGVLEFQGAELVVNLPVPVVPLEAWLLVSVAVEEIPHLADAAGVHRGGHDLHVPGVLGALALLLLLAL